MYSLVCLTLALTLTLALVSVHVFNLGLTLRIEILSTQKGDYQRCTGILKNNTAKWHSAQTDLLVSIRFTDSQQSPLEFLLCQA